MSLLIHGVVGEFDFLEGDFVLHPLGAGSGRIGMRVDPGRPLRFRFARTDPSGVEAEARIVGQHQIHQHKVFHVGIQSAHAHFQRREHPAPQFGDDHLGADAVELVPQFGVFQIDLDVGIALHRRQRMVQQRITSCWMQIRRHSGAAQFYSQKNATKLD